MNNTKEFNTNTFEGKLQIVPNIAIKTVNLEKSQLQKYEDCLNEFNIVLVDHDILIKVMVGDDEIEDWNSDGIPPHIVKNIGSDSLINNSINCQFYPLFPKYLPLSSLINLKEEDVLTITVGDINIDLTCTQGKFKEFGKFEEVLFKVLKAFIKEGD